MSTPEDDRRRAHRDPLPGLPGTARQRRLVIFMAIMLVATDRLWLGHRLFGSALWRECLWAISCCGLAIGGAAHVRTARR